MMLIFLFAYPSFAGSLLGESQKVVDISSNGGIPQVPNISPDGKKLVYEIATKKGTELWIADTDGKNPKSLTGTFQKSGKLPAIVENSAWHPKGNYLAFEGQVSTNEHQIFIAQIENGKIVKHAKLLMGRRPHFSYPYGRALFSEVGESLKYMVLGADPFRANDIEYVPLRGPIQTVAGMEFTHPQLSRDGNTIFFAAGAGVKTIQNPIFSEVFKRLRLDAIGRQRMMAIWPKLSVIPAEKVITSLKSLCAFFSQVDAPLLPNSIPSHLIEEFGKDFAKIDLDKPAKEMSGISNRDLLRAWAFGFLAERPLAQTEIEKRLGSKIWSTDLFGGSLKAIAESSPLPQKFPTSTADSKYVVFEAGIFSNRHLYVVNVGNGKSLPLTHQGTYNSSPNLSPDDQMIYFETNETGKKQIRRAAIDWNAVHAALQ